MIEGIAGAIAGFCAGAVVVAKFLTRRISKVEAETILNQAKAVYEAYEEAKKVESSGAEEITKEEWAAIGEKGAKLAESIFKAIKE